MMKLTLELTPAQLYFLDMALAEQEEYAVSDTCLTILGQPVPELYADLMEKVDTLMQEHEIC